jgi:hypothetical protein
MLKEINVAEIMNQSDIDGALDEWYCLLSKLA